MDRLKRWATLDAAYVASLAAVALGSGLIWGVGAALVVGGLLGGLSVLGLAVARARSGEDTTVE